MTAVRDLMTESPKTVGPEASVADALALMDRLHARHVPVVDEDGNLMGLVSQRDLLRSVLHTVEDVPLTTQRAVLHEVPIAGSMNNSVESVEPDTDIREAGELMMEHKFGCLPVCEGQRLVGILTETDFIRFVVERSD